MMLGIISFVMRARYLAVGVLMTGAMLALWGVNGKKSTPRYSLSVTFAGYTNLDERSSESARYCRRFGGTPEPGLHNYGQCVLLAVTNNGSRQLQFHSRGVEYEAAGHWQEVRLGRWVGLEGWRWLPGAGATVAVSVPPELPAGAKWRIRLVCALDSNSGPRQKLNEFTRQYFGRDSLTFYSPAAMRTSEIPPQEQRIGPSDAAEQTNRASQTAGSGR